MLRWPYHLRSLLSVKTKANLKSQTRLQVLFFLCPQNPLLRRWVISCHPIRAVKEASGKKVEIVILSTLLENREHGKPNEFSNSNIVITPQDIKELIAQGIKQYQVAMNALVLGYKNLYPSHYDAVLFPKGYQKPNFEMFDGIIDHCMNIYLIST